MMVIINMIIMVIINIIIMVIINMIKMVIINIMMVVQDQAATIQTLEAERNKLREQCAEISQRSLIIFMSVVVVVFLLIFTITVLILTQWSAWSTSPT